jgi:superfamily II DNA or RNA helicase
VVQGSTDKDIREAVRVSTESSEGTIIIATYGVFSTGISIKNLQYIIFASGSKSVIRVLQSIGRGLRKDGKENKVTVIDIADSFGMGKATNYILRHFFERIKIYTSEKFSYKIKTINI